MENSFNFTDQYQEFLKTSDSSYKVIHAGSDVIPNHGPCPWDECRCEGGFVTVVDLDDPKALRCWNCNFNPSFKYPTECGTMGEDWNIAGACGGFENYRRLNFDYLPKPFTSDAAFYTWFEANVGTLFPSPTKDTEKFDRWLDLNCPDEYESYLASKSDDDESPSVSESDDDETPGVTESEVNQV